MAQNPFALLTLAIFFGLPVYTIVRILIKGSLFEGFRDWINLNAPEKLRQLFGCHVCLGAQISLWCISLPLHAFFGSPFQNFVPELNTFWHVVFIFGSWFTFAMAATSIHYLLWAITVDRPVPAKQPIQLTVSGIQQGGAVSDNNSGVTFKENEYRDGRITFVEFSNLVFYVQYSCDNITCMFARPECIKAGVQMFLAGKMMRAMNLKGHGKIPEQKFELLLEKLYKAVRAVVNFDDTMGSVGWNENLTEAYDKFEINEIDVLEEV